MIKSSISRRSVLRNAGFAGILGTIGVREISKIATAGTPCSYGGSVEWDRSYGDKQRGNDGRAEYVVDHAVGLEYYGSVLNTSNVYQHEFRFTSVAAGRGRHPNKDDWKKKFANTAKINVHEFTLDASGLRYQSLLTGGDRCNIGCTPPPSEPRATPDYSSVAISAASLAIGRLDPRIAAGITAAKIVNALVNTKSPDVPPNIASKRWEYGNGTISYDASHFFRFSLEQRDGCRLCRFNVENIASSIGAGGTRSKTRVTLEPPIPGGLCGAPSTKLSGFNEILSILSEQHSVEKIPQRVIETTPTLRDFSHGGPLYRVAFPFTLRL